MTKKKKTVDSNMPHSSNCKTPSSGSNLAAMPVSGGSSGSGLPYAPENWPLDGDVWGWKVGYRSTVSGFFADRILYPPQRIQKLRGCTGGFQSKVSVKEFIKKEYPRVDPDAFFASFLWNIPCLGVLPRKQGGKGGHSEMSTKRLEIEKQPPSQKDPAVVCKAGNNMCSIRKKAESEVTIKNCDICCSEADFCCNCCCILCCETIDCAYGGYSFIRCEANLEDNFICGHAAHVECAVRCYLAGSVGGNIGLDAEYYCRRCDNKSDVTSHVEKLLRTSESLDSHDNIRRVLNMCLCLLRGSERERAKELRNRIGVIMAMLKHGADHHDIWNADDSYSSDVPDPKSDIVLLGAANISKDEKTVNLKSQVSQVSDMINSQAQNSDRIKSSKHISELVHLESQVDEVLQELKRSQEAEYTTAEQKLYAHRDVLLSLYQQRNIKSFSHANSIFAISNVTEKINYEEEKLRDMMKVAKGFGKTPGRVLTEHFGLCIEDDLN